MIVSSHNPSQNPPEFHIIRPENPVYFTKSFPKCSEGQKMNFYTFRSVRKAGKWIFRGSEVFGRTGNGFLFILSRSEASKMNFYTFRVARRGRKWIFKGSEWLGRGFSFNLQTASVSFIFILQIFTVSFFFVKVSR